MGQLKKRLRRLLVHPFFLDAALTVLCLGIRSSKSGTHLIVTAPGRGNIGDAAMLEAFADGVAGDVTAIVRTGSDFGSYPGCTRSVSFESLLYGRVPGVFGDAVRLRRFFRNAASLSIVGADIMDGAYQNEASCRRAIVAKHAARAGLDARVLGFSWNGAPTKNALNSIAAAGRAGVKLMARDPASAERLRGASVPNVHEVADIVFTASTREDLPDDVRLPPRPYVLVNASSYVAKQGGDVLTAYVALVAQQISQGRDVVLVPHVVREGGDPLVVREIYAQLNEDQRQHVLLIDRMLSPRQIRELTARAHIVVTGRMHLSVMSLRQGVPTAVVGTQGKVEGMMRLFSLEDYVIQPEAIPGGMLSEVAERMLVEHDRLRARIAENLPKVVSLADMNFSGLPR